MYDVSVIVTTYNAEDTVNRAVSSLLNKAFSNRIEVIIVDDCSSDNTQKIIKELASKNSNIRYEFLKENTGSPSEPRNIGMDMATGEYLTFLDDDDWIDSYEMLKIIDYASSNNLECVKGYLTVVDDSGFHKTNKIIKRKYDSIIEDIIAQQSTTIDIILKRDFVIEHKIKFRTDLKIGEDTVFYSIVFAKTSNVNYINKSFYFYNKLRGTELSTTQNYGNNELNMHLKAWETAEEQLEKIQLSYYQLRLPTAIKNTITSIVNFSQGMIDKITFEKFSEFVNINKAYLKNINLIDRYQEVLDAVYAKDFEKFLVISKKRILIAGYDLKFITPVIPYLQKQYNILIDEWTGHNEHNEKKSKELLAQADIIWCEWLLGNAVWYSKHKQKHQKLVIRAHRFEITREFGYQIDYGNVNKVFAVGYYYMEEFQRKFDIPRNKMQLLSNYVEPEIYTGLKTENYLFNIGLVGVTPKRKGFFKGLEILKTLRKEDERYKLYVIGTRPEETSWIMNDLVEKEYYKNCSSYIADNELEESVILTGWMPKEKMFHNIGFVLSLSGSEQPESFHLAPAEAYCDNTMGLFLYWPGVEYIYPKEIIFKDQGNIVDYILEMNENPEKYSNELERIKQFIINNYSIEIFLNKLNTALLTL